MCKRFEELIEQIEADLNSNERFKEKLVWIKSRVNHYHEKLGFSEVEILEAFEQKRDCSAASYYRESKFPLLDNKVKIFADALELKEATKSRRFVCPACSSVQSSPYECTSGQKSKDGEECNWKSYGLFGTLGKGFRYTLKDTFLETPIVDDVFMPVEFKDTDYNPIRY